MHSKASRGLAKDFISLKVSNVYGTTHVRNLRKEPCRILVGTLSFVFILLSNFTTYFHTSAKLIFLILNRLDV